MMEYIASLADPPSDIGLEFENILNPRDVNTAFMDTARSRASSKNEDSHHCQDAIESMWSDMGLDTHDSRSFLPGK